MACRGSEIVQEDDRTLNNRNHSRMNGECGSRAVRKAPARLDSKAKQRGGAKDRSSWQRNSMDGCVPRVGVMTRAQKRKFCMEDALEPPQRFSNVKYISRGLGMNNKAARICPPDPRSRPSFIEEFSDMDSDSEETCTSRRHVNANEHGLCLSSGNGKLEAEVSYHEANVAREASTASEGPSRSWPRSTVGAELEPGAAEEALAVVPPTSSSQPEAVTCIADVSFLQSSSIADNALNIVQAEHAVDAAERVRVETGHIKEAGGIRNISGAEPQEVVSGASVDRITNDDSKAAVDENVHASSGGNSTACGTVENGFAGRGRAGGLVPLSRIVGPAGSVPGPEGIENDRAQVGNGYYARQSLSSKSEQCGDYSEDIFRNLLLREKTSHSPRQLLETTQPDINSEHRKVMVNWLVEFSLEFKLQVETLFLGVAIMDRCLSEGPKLRCQILQLLGMASMLIASKYEETHSPMVLRDCCEVADHTFTQTQILKMETTVLKILGFECAMPTVMSFLWHILKAVNADKRMERMAEYLACLSLMDEGLLNFLPSVVATASVFLAFYTLKREHWSASLNVWCGYDAVNLQRCVRRLYAMQGEKELRTCNLSGVWDKYSSVDQMGVALAPKPKSLPQCLYSRAHDPTGAAHGKECRSSKGQDKTF